MKKSIIFFILFFSFYSSLSARVKSMYQEIRLTPENIERTLESLEYGYGYSIVFEDDFDFKLLDKKYFQLKMIEQIHTLFENDCDLKFSGPFDYIYLEDSADKQFYSKVKAILENSKEKYICIDLSNATVANQNNELNLPVNCFSNYDNLYWVYLGDIKKQNISANFCKGCKNLQCVFMWNQGKLEKGCFENTNEEVMVYSKENPQMTVIAQINKFVLFEFIEPKTENPDWDFVNFKADFELNEFYQDVNPLYDEPVFDEKPIYPDFSGVSWLIDAEDLIEPFDKKSWWEKTSY